MHIATVIDHSDGLFRAWDLDRTEDGYELCEITEVHGTPVPPSRVVMPPEQALAMAWAIIGQREMVL
jgi:hypothetical protein